MTIESVGALAIMLLSASLCILSPVSCLLHDPLDMAQRLLRGALPRVAREYSGGLRKLLAAGSGGAQEPAESRGGGLDIAARHVFSRPRVHFACNRRVEHDNRHASGPGLQRGQAEPLILGEEGKDRGMRVEFAQFVLANITEDLHLRAGPG